MYIYIFLHSFIWKMKAIYYKLLSFWKMTPIQKIYVFTPFEIDPDDGPGLLFCVLSEINVGYSWLIWHC